MLFQLFNSLLPFSTHNSLLFPKCILAHGFVIALFLNFRNEYVSIQSLNKINCTLHFFVEKQNYNIGVRLLVPKISSPAHFSESIKFQSAFLTSYVANANRSTCLQSLHSIPQTSTLLPLGTQDLN